VNDAMTSSYEGDPCVNESYFNYGDTIYAAADGKVFEVRDGMIENNGNQMDQLPVSMAGVPGNYMIQDIGNGNYAFYAHLIPGSLKVSVGDIIKSGEAIGLIGNSGYSGMPHLHFNISEGSDSFWSKGLPFVFRNCTWVGIMDQGSVTPVNLKNTMPEQMSVIAF
jgi:murein DD-endopeptidase MepM/ murein hydrolase activator NlpD